MEVRVIGYADDIAVFVVAWHKAQVAKICNQVVRVIAAWMLNFGLVIA